MAVDHDRLFKELLKHFSLSSSIVLPQACGGMDRGSIEFLSQELFPNLLDGGEYLADILVKARFKEQDAFFLVHVEHQSEARAIFPRRFFRYFSAIFEKHGFPVYPIVLYSNERPKKSQPNFTRSIFRMALYCASITG